jgi:PilZ domain
LAAPGRKHITTPDRRHRRFPRYRTNFPVAVELLLEKEYQRLDGQCKDLSIAGIGALLTEELATGEVLALTFSLPVSAVVWHVRTVVRHRRKYHHGLEFLSLSQEQSALLAAYLAGLERAD